MRNGIALILILLGLLGSASAVAQQARPELQSRPTQARPVSEYRINAGDELEVYVWGEERLQRAVKVLPDGTIAFPLVGQVVAQGLLPQDLERAISARLEGQYRGQVPQVTVSVAAPRAMIKCDTLTVRSRCRRAGSRRCWQARRDPGLLRL